MIYINKDGGLITAVGLLSSGFMKINSFLKRLLSASVVTLIFEYYLCYAANSRQSKQE